MAFGSVGSFGTANSVASGTTLALTPTATLEVGNLAMLVISADNIAVGTSPVAEFGHKISNVSSVTDTGGNTWHKLGEVAGNQAADGGNAVALYYSIITTQLTTGSTVTVTFGTAITSKACSGWEFTIGGSSLAVERIRFRGTAASDPPSITLDDLPSREYLFFRARASETDNTSWTATTNFTGITNATADAGAAGVGSSANGEFRIVTSTSQTSDPTKTSSDGADIFIALWEGSQADSGPWVVTGNALQSGTGALTVPWALGHEVDDIALLVCESSNGETVTLTTANGFAETDSSPQDASNSKLAAFWCRATSTSMASPVTNDPGDHINTKMYLIRGCHNSGNPWDAITGNTGASSTSVTCPEVTTTVNRCLILWICSQGSDLVSDEFSGWGNSGSTRVEELDAISTTAGNGGGHGIAYGYKETAGATGTATATLATASGQGRITIALKPQQASGQTITVNQVTETNLSQVITRVKNKLVNQIDETNLSQAITRVKQFAIAQITETDIAQSVQWAPKNRMVSQIAETDTPQQVISRKIKVVAMIEEVNVAQSVSPGKAVAITQVTEVDSPQAISIRKIMGILQVTETDLSQPVGRVKYLAIAQTLEVDSSQIVTPKKIKIITQVLETNLSQTITSQKIISVAQVLETNLSQSISSRKIYTILQALEVDTSQSISSRKIYTLGIISEVDLAQPISIQGAAIVRQVGEVDIAQLLGIVKIKGVGQALEIDTSQPISHLKITSIAQVLENNIAQPFTSRKIKEIIQVNEVDLAQAVELGGPITVIVDQVLEIDMAGAIIVTFIGIVRTGRAVLREVAVYRGKIRENVIYAAKITEFPHRAKTSEER